MKRQTHQLMSPAVGRRSRLLQMLPDLPLLQRLLAAEVLLLVAALRARASA